MGSCDVPDLAVFPARYPGLRTVTFHAGFASDVGHLVVYALAGLVRLASAAECGAVRPSAESTGADDRAPREPSRRHVRDARRHRSGPQRVVADVESLGRAESRSADSVRSRCRARAQARGRRGVARWARCRASACCPSMSISRRSRISTFVRLGLAADNGTALPRRTLARSANKSLGSPRQAFHD